MKQHYWVKGETETKSSTVVTILAESATEAKEIFKKRYSRYSKNIAAKKIGDGPKAPQWK